MTLRPQQLADIYQRLRGRFGHQEWWPGDTALEICIGAILTQHTSWHNVEKAIGNLCQKDLLNLSALEQIHETQLAEHIRPAGFYRVKARRMKAFVDAICLQFDGNLEALFDLGRQTARDKLLSIHGIGPETADCILLYAGGLPSFVVDAYTKRIFQRHHWISPSADYQQLKATCENAQLPPPNQGIVDYWQDYHAQIVRLGKEYCHSKQPNCTDCPLQVLLPDETQGQRSAKKPRTEAEHSN